MSLGEIKQQHQPACQAAYREAALRVAKRMRAVAQGGDGDVLHQLRMLEAVQEGLLYLLAHNGLEPRSVVCVLGETAARAFHGLPDDDATSESLEALELGQDLAGLMIAAASDREGRLRARRAVDASARRDKSYDAAIRLDALRCVERAVRRLATFGAEASSFHLRWELAELHPSFAEIDLTRTSEYLQKASSSKNGSAWGMPGVTARLLVDAGLAADDLQLLTDAIRKLTAAARTRSKHAASSSSASLAPRVADAAAE